MKKINLVRMTIGLLLLLLFIVMPAYARPPQEAEGLWQYQPIILEVKESGCNTFLTTFEDGLWTGTFDGSSTEDARVVIHCNGSWSFHATVTFDQVTVDGKSGTLEMKVNGSRPDAFSDWTGRWVITDGTDGLENLHGQGTWEGPGSPGGGEWGDIFYYGQIHFGPN